MEDLPPAIPLRDPSVTSRESNNNEHYDDDEHCDNNFSPQVSRIQTSINEQNSSPGGQSHFVSSASVEPNFTKNGNNIGGGNSAFSRLQNFAPPSPEEYSNQQQRNDHHTLPLATMPEQQPKLYQRHCAHSNSKPLFGVDPIGRLLSFNTATTTDDEKSSNNNNNNRSSDYDEGSRTPAGKEEQASEGNISTTNNNNNNESQQQQEEASAAKSAGTNAESIMIGSPFSPATESQQQKQQQEQPQRDPNAPVVVPASVTNRRRMAAALRAPLRNNNNNTTSSATPTPSNIEAYQTSFRSGNDDDDDSDYDDNTSAGFRSVSHQSQQQNQQNHHNFSPSSILGELPAYSSPITGGDGGMSLVTVLEEYNVIRNCRAWLTETQARSFQSLGTQGDQLLDWQRRRLEQQSEGILDDLASALNPSTIAEMFDAIASSLDQVENVMEPAFQDKITELTSLRNTTAGYGNNGNEDGDGSTTSQTVAGMKALSSYVNLLSLEADRILDLTSNIHVSLDSLKADLAEARSGDASFDLDRKQSRRNFSQKVSILEDESRQLKLDLRREMKVSLDRDRKAKKRFDKVHGQLEALLKGAELFDEVREQLADAAKDLEDVFSQTVKLRLNHNKEMTAAQESEEQQEDGFNSPNAPSPNSKAGIQYYQRVAAVSRKLREHGFDLAAMMSPSAQKEKEYTLNADGSVKIPTLYQKTNTACFVDPSIVFATDNAKDLGAIEDIADEYFAPMAMEAYDYRRGGNNNGSSADDDEEQQDARNRSYLNKRLGNPSTKNNGNSNNNNYPPQRNFATPPVPVALSTKPATLDHLEKEAKDQAAEILREAQLRTEDANNLLNEARRRAAAATGTPLLPQYQQQQNGNNNDYSRSTEERPRLPSAAIPDARIDSVDRIRPQSPDDSQALRSATTLRDLVPAPLRGFLPKEQEEKQPEEDQEQPQKEEGKENTEQDDDNDEEKKQQEGEDHVNQTPTDEPLSQKKPISSRTSSIHSNQPPAATTYSNPKRPRRGSMNSNSNNDNNNNNLSKPGELPESISYKVGMPFGTTGTVAGEESTLDQQLPHQKSHSRSSSQEPRATSLSLSEARRRRKEEKLRQQQQQQKHPEISPQRQQNQLHYSPYDDRTPPQLRGFPTPSVEDAHLGDANNNDNDNNNNNNHYNDIAYVSAPNHTGTPGTTDQFYYPHHNKKNNPVPATVSAAATNKKKSPSSSLKPTNIKARVDSNNHRPSQRSSRTSSADQQPQQQQNQQQQNKRGEGLPSIFDEVKTPHADKYDDEHFYDDLDNFDGALEDYGANPENEDHPDEILIDLTGSNNNTNNRKKPAARGVPKPSTFSKGVLSSNPPTTTTTANRKGTPTSSRSHVAAPLPTTSSNRTSSSSKAKPPIVVADIDLSQYATKSKGVPYDDRDGHYESLAGAGADRNNNNSNDLPALFADPSLGGHNNDNSPIHNRLRDYNNPRSGSGTSLPTWIDLMNTKTNIQQEFNPEYMDIARYRLEQERNDPSRLGAISNNHLNNYPNSSNAMNSPTTSGGPLDRRNYELLPSVGLNRAIKDSDQQRPSNKRNSSVSFVEPSLSVTGSNSKLAGIPMVATNPSPSQRANAPFGGHHSYPQTSRVPSFVVPPAPKPSSSYGNNNNNNYNNNNNRSDIHTPVDSTGSQEDIRRHLDRLKLDQQEAIAKFRGSPAVQSMF